MALLVGRDDIAAFTGSSFFGFGGGNSNVSAFPTLIDGTADTLNVAIVAFGPNTVVRCVLYEQVGGLGDFNEVARVDIPSSIGGSPQSVSLVPAVPVVTGNNYHLGMWGDVTATPAGGNYGWALDPLIVGPPDGTAGLIQEFGSEPDPLIPLPEYAANGQAYWNLDGSPAVSENLGLRETFFTKGTTNVIPDGSYDVRVIDPSDRTVIISTVLPSVSGVITVDDQVLGMVGNVFWLEIRNVVETNQDVAVTTVPSTVIDLDA